MQKQSMKKQTVLLAVTNTFVRALGFIMRIVFSRLMGAQAIGIMELAASAHMLAIAPVAAGMPLAVSRLAAKADKTEATLILSSAKRLNDKIAFTLIPIVLVLSPVIAHLLGDERTFPAIIMCVPCIWILSRTAVYNGYCYGRSNATLPALSELTEQVVRFVIALSLLLSFKHLSIAWLAALPGFAALLAEGAGLITICALLNFTPLPKGSKDIENKLFRLALPPTLMRLSNTLLRSINAVLVPFQLRASGLMAAEATASFGLLSGMVMPVLFLPSVITGALAMISSPKMASLEGKPKSLKRMALKILCAAFSIGSVCALIIYLMAPAIGIKLYRQAELIDLLRFSCPSVVFLSINQVLNGMIAGIGRQKHALYASILSALITVTINLFLTSSPSFRIYGALIAMMAGQIISVFSNLRLLMNALQKSILRGDISV